jgi:predicted DNA-binding protein
MTNHSRKRTITERASLRLPPELLEQLERVAERERRPLSNLLRNVLTDFVQQTYLPPERRPA